MRASLAILIAGFMAATAAAQESLPLQQVSAIKDATVLILTGPGPDAPPTSSGSGFLIRKDGQTGFIVTNNHVISSHDRNSRTKPASKIVFRSGTKKERKVAASLVAASAEMDLAVLKVEGVPDLPAAMDVEKETELVETMPIYIFGFPFGEALAPDLGKISVVVGRGSVSSVRMGDDGKARAVLIDGALNPGNSGGPVVDAKGRLVGVAVATIRGAHIGIAIAPTELQGMLEGRVEALKVSPRKEAEGAVELAVDVALADPLGKFKSMKILYGAGGPKDAAETKGDKQASWPPLAGAKSAALQIEGQRGRGTVKVPTRPGEDVVVSYQIAYTNSQGRTVHMRPSRYVLARSKAGSSGFRAWGEVLDPDGDCKVTLEQAAVTFELPGKHKDLNSDIARLNAPRVLQEVEGDFVAQVRVVGKFEPEGPSTRDAAFPCNGAGLVVWLDAENYVRFERMTVLRGEKIGAFLNFERREQGQVNAKNNGRIVEGDVYLKIERRDDRLIGSISSDGRRWTPAKPMDIAWPAKLKVGIDAVSSSFEPFPVRFEEFSITKPGGDK